jgi:hypothetical protein
VKVAWYFADSSLQELNTSLHRVIYPSKMMEEAGHECRIAHVSSLFASQDLSNAEWSDVVVIERLLVEEVYDAIRMFGNAGKKVFCTFDDAYHLMPSSPARDTWRGGKTSRNGQGSILNEFREGLRLCYGALVPSKLLAEDYRSYQPNIHYVPNYLYLPLWKNLPPKNPDIITIGWGGTSLHNISWKDSGVIPALGKICKRYPKVIVHLQPPYPDIVVSMEKAGVRYVLGAWQPFEEWPKTVAKFHIGLAPLSGLYDSRRSNLKALEYATLGIPWIATDDAPYKESYGGILVNNRMQSWYDALEELITDKQSYAVYSESGRAWSERFNGDCVGRYEAVLNG